MSCAGDVVRGDGSWDAASAHRSRSGRTDFIELRAAPTVLQIRANPSPRTRIRLVPQFGSSGAGDCLTIAALGAGAAYHKLWSKSNLLMLVTNFAVGCLDFFKEQLSRPIANGKPRLADRGQRDSSRRGKCNVVVADNRHIVWYPHSSRHEALQQTDCKQVICPKYRGRSLRAGHSGYFLRSSNARVHVKMRTGLDQNLR
jgi:hypothetical protein